LGNNYSVFLGDNPFFGVNHLSQELARQKATKSQNFDNILEVMNYSFNLGVKRMVISTHPELRDLIQHLKTNSDLIYKFHFYPILPYAQGYVSRVTEMGMINTLQEILSSAGLKNKIRMLAQGGLGVIRKDFHKLFTVLIDLELLQLKNAKIKTVFLHDVVTDLALALNIKSIFKSFQDHVHDAHRADVGFVTKNFPLLISKMREWDLYFPKIMTSFNKVGFQMNPSKLKCEQTLSEYEGEVIAMSVLAGGYLELKEAYDYISTLPKIRTVVIGISSTEHAQSTFKLFLDGN